MSNLVVRKIIEIDEELCNGCGMCVLDCHENAIAIIDGKAKIIRDSMCDGLGNCLGRCPVDAITIIERLAEPFDEAFLPKEPVVKHADAGCGCNSTGNLKPSGCPSSRAKEMAPLKGGNAETEVYGPGHWPLKLALVSESAPFLKGADIVVAADCAAFHDPRFHEKYANGRPLLIGCPKMSDTNEMIHKLAAIFAVSGIASCTVVRMEVPCCGGLTMAVNEAMKRSGKNIPIHISIMDIFSGMK